MSIAKNLRAITPWYHKLHCHPYRNVGTWFAACLQKTGSERFANHDGCQNSRGCSFFKYGEKYSLVVSMTQMAPWQLDFVTNLQLIVAVSTSLMGYAVYWTAVSKASAFSHKSCGNSFQAKTHRHLTALLLRPSVGTCGHYATSNDCQCVQGGLNGHTVMKSAVHKHA